MKPHSPIRLLFLSTLLLSLSAEGYWPLPDFPNYLTSTFGEYRNGHLHRGIDIGTKGKTGFPVVAFQDGWVVRVQSTRRGYGKALYIRHPNGYLTLYAHLSSFSPPIQNLLLQMGAPRYFDRILQGSEEIPVKAGQVIGYSGESGAGLPHLHFEIRRGWWFSIDPLTFQLNFQDTQPPILEYLLLIPFSPQSRVNGTQSPFIIPLTQLDNGWKEKKAWSIQGPVQVELTGYDPGEGWTRRGLSFLHSEVRSSTGELVFCFQQDLQQWPSSPDFSVNVIYQPLRSHIGPTVFTYRLYALRETDEPCRDTALKLPAPGDYELRIEARDTSGNTTVADIPLRSSESYSSSAPQTSSEENPGAESTPETFPSPSLEAESLEPLVPRFSSTSHSLRVDSYVAPDTESVEVHLYHKGNQWNSVFQNFPSRRLSALLPLQDSGLYTLTLIYYASTGRTVIHQQNLIGFQATPDEPFEGIWENLRLMVEKGGFLRKTLVFLVPSTSGEYPKTEGLPFLLPPFRLEPEGEPLVKSGTLTLQYERVNRQSGIYSWDPFRMRWRYLPSHREGKILKAEIDFFQAYAVLQDEAPPLIYPPEIVTLDEPHWVVRISDVGSGVNPDSVKVWWNGQRIESEYDEDRGWVWLDVPPALSGGEWKVEAQDYAGNESRRTTPPTHSP